jgi:hypothetical protein
MVNFDRIKKTFKTADWNAWYFFTLGALIASEFSLISTFYCSIGAAAGFVLLNALGSRS